MGVHSDEGGHHACSLPRAFVAVHVGFGCLFAVCPFSSLGTAALLLKDMGWHEILFVRMTYMVVGAVGLLLGEMTFRSAPTREVDSRRPVIAGGIVAGLANVLLFASGPSIPRWLVATAYGTATGMSLALEAEVWMRSFFSVRKMLGRQTFITALASSFLLTVVLTWAADHAGATGPRLLVVMEVLVALGCALFVPVARNPEVSEGPRRAANREFVSSGSVQKVLLALGFLWGLGYSMPIDMGYGTLSSQSFFRWVTTLLACGALLVGVMVLARAVDIDTVHFGLILRWLIAFSGIAWAFEPLLIERATLAASILFILTFWVQLMGLLVLIAEVSLEANLPLRMVLERYLSLFVAGSCAGAVVFLLARTLSGDVFDSYDLIAALGVTVSLLVMPFMPSRGSNAYALTLESLPEDESATVRSERARQEFVERHAFTPREVQVFNLLLAGDSRDDIARRLAISPLTAKNHIHAVYNKVGVHSSRELMALVYGSQEGWGHGEMELRPQMASPLEAPPEAR